MWDESLRAFFQFLFDSEADLVSSCNSRLTNQPQPEMRKCVNDYSVFRCLHISVLAFASHVVTCLAGFIQPANQNADISAFGFFQPSFCADFLLFLCVFFCRPIMTVASVSYVSADVFTLCSQSLTYKDLCSRRVF